MKNILLMLLIVNCSFVMAQTDQIYLHNGKTLEVNVKGIANGVITYSYPQEKVTMEISEHLVEKIIFTSGRVQQISEKVIVKDINDWENVIITNIESDIKGLVRKGEVSETQRGSSASKTHKIQQTAENKMNMKAAEMGAHIIFIKNYNVRHGDFWWTGQSAKVSVSGIAYGYE